MEIARTLSVLARGFTCLPMVLLTFGCSSAAGDQELTQTDQSEVKGKVAKKSLAFLVGEGNTINFEGRATFAVGLFSTDVLTTKRLMDQAFPNLDPNGNPLKFRTSVYQSYATAAAACERQGLRLPYAAEIGSRGRDILAALAAAYPITYYDQLVGGGTYPGAVPVHPLRTPYGTQLPRANAIFVQDQPAADHYYWVALDGGGLVDFTAAAKRYQVCNIGFSGGTVGAPNCSRVDFGSEYTVASICISSVKPPPVADEGKRPPGTVYAIGPRVYYVRPDAEAASSRALLNLGGGELAITQHSRSRQRRRV